MINSSFHTPVMHFGKLHSKTGILCSHGSPLKIRLGFGWGWPTCTLPNRWACLKCCKLHHIDTSDVPAAFQTVRYRGVPCSIKHSRGIEVEGYSMQHYHIQFALKLSRLGKVHQRYLAALMDTYTRTGIAFIPPLADSYTAEPRIINKRFILREEWNIRNNTSTALPLFPDKSRLPLPVCPHMRMLFGGPARSRSWKQSSIHWMVHMSNNNNMRQLEEFTLLKEVTLLEDGIALAYESLGQWIFNSCLHCPTDFAIMISTDEREATIRAWHDFGIEGSPIDIRWKAHVADKSRHWLDVGPYVDYNHGSIRELWSEGISHRTRTSQAKLRSVFTKLIESLSEV